MSVVLYGVGSPLVVDLEESCARLNLSIAGAVKNVDGPVHTISDAPVYVADELPDSLVTLPFLVPIFTPGRRRLAVDDAQRRGFTDAFVLIDPTSIVARSTAIGPGSFVNSGAIVGGAGSIGRFVLVNRGASVGHHARIADYVSLGPGALLGSHVSLGRGAVIGMGAIVTPDITIGDNAVVSAGSLVTRNVPARALVRGQPARVLRSDIIGYNDLAA
jgi:sugar O-acyltransferase (sialic acid O-acetyltransferase NeuD family)